MSNLTLETLKNLEPNQVIVFSSADDSYGVGSLETIKSKCIKSFTHEEETGYNVVTYIIEGDVEDSWGYLPFYDFLILPPLVTIESLNLLIP